MDILRKDLLNTYAAALKRVEGAEAVRLGLAHTKLPDRPVAVAAIGKAAASMARGASEFLGPRLERGLVITKRGHLEETRDERFTYVVADHPLPTEASLKAGAQLIEFLQTIPDEYHLLVLISGGASSLVESLRSGLSLEDLQRVNQVLLGSGMDIAQVNAVRRRISRLKGGGATQYLGAYSVQVMLISDVPGDDPAVIGSGLFYVPNTHFDAEPVWPESLQDIRARASGTLGAAPLHKNIPHEIIANPRIAAEAAAQQAQALGYTALLETEFLGDDVELVSKKIIAALADEVPACHIWNGEPTVNLPAHPGRGGRNQHLALLVAKELVGQSGVAVLVAGTDGTDGPTDDAGAIVDGKTLLRGEQLGLNVTQTLESFDAGTYLEATGDLLTTGPTGTNVMDLVISLRRS